MCHRSVGLLQNALEEAGFSTSSLSVQAMITLGVGVPRAAFVRFPIGNALGPPGDVAVQDAIIKDILDLVWEAPGPRTVVELPYRWRRGVPKDRASGA
jgi:D-proline reductase (dithiol) PrdB